MDNSFDKTGVEGKKESSDYIPPGAVAPSEVSKEPELEGISLELKDYIALCIAALQTVVAPMALFIVAILILLVIFNLIT